MTKGVLRNFTIFAGRHLCQSLVFNKVAGWRLQLLKKSLWHRCFPMNFAKFLRTTFLQNTPDDCFCFILFHAVRTETFIINEIAFIKFYKTFEWKIDSVSIFVIQLLNWKKISKLDSLEWKSNELVTFKWKSSELDSYEWKWETSHFWMKKELIRQFSIKKWQTGQFWRKR